MTGCPAPARSPTRARQAFEAYERAGLPHRRIEDWKYTDLRALMREVLPLAAAPDAAALKRAEAALKPHAIDGVRRLVLVDGVFAPELSDTRDLEKASASARCAKCWKPATPRCKRICWRLTIPMPWWR